MSKCRHNTCSTPFCPQCGSRLERFTLDALLNHLEETARVRRGMFEKECLRCPDYKDDKKALGVIAKWETWAKLLKEVIHAK